MKSNTELLKNMTDFQQIVSVILVIKCQNKFLLVQRSKNDNLLPGLWQNMGGKIEPGERVEHTIVREMMEEVGLKPESTPVFIQSYSWKKDEKSPVRLGLIFLIDLKNKIKSYKIKLCDELENYGWHTIDEAKKLKTIGEKSPTGTLGQLGEAIK